MAKSKSSKVEEHSMFPVWFYEAWNKIKQQVSGVKTSKKKSRPEPVPRVYKNTVFYVFPDGKTKPVWQQSPQGGRIVAKLEFDTDGLSRLTILKEVQNMGPVAFMATEFVYQHFNVQTLYFLDIVIVKKIVE